MAAGQSGAAELKGGQDLQASPELVILRPWLSERIWGCTELPSFLEQPKPGHPIGEAWLTAAQCVVEGQGELTLGELARRWPGSFGADECGEFPLLIKFLFPREKLSVQVHPNDEEARAIGQPRGKNECWYVLSAEPGAELALGFREELTRAEMERAIHDGTLESKLRYLPVKAGDMAYVEAGTIHAIGPGLVILETQQYSDTTYRLYDYGRPRPLHLTEGLAVTKAHTNAGLVAPVKHDGFVRLIRSPYFVVDRFELSSGVSRPLGLDGRMQILIALKNGAAIRLGSERSVHLPAGHAMVLTAKPNVSHTLEGSENVEIIRIATGTN
ncbi:MAG TPA: type I phosphomannose isomerase catalytic subunit [Acidobacteriaceae bacterium]